MNDIKRAPPHFSTFRKAQTNLSTTPSICVNMRLFQFLTFILLVSITLTSCENESEKRQGLESEEQGRIETEKENEQARIKTERENKEELAAQAVILEREREEQAIYNRYINNSLRTGGTPYSNCYGGNSSCGEWGCSAITVIAPNNSDVLVTIKKNESTVQHAYIKAGGTYTFELRNGTYQPFFYYGKGWNPEKIMKQTSCGNITGGFISEESFGKDDPQDLSNGRLQYTLVLQENGNFSTIPSDSNEAL